MTRRRERGRVKRRRWSTVKTAVDGGACQRVAVVGGGLVADLGW